MPQINSWTLYILQNLNDDGYLYVLYLCIWTIFRVQKPLEYSIQLILKKKIRCSQIHFHTPWCNKCCNICVILTILRAKYQCYNVWTCPKPSNQWRISWTIFSQINLHTTIYAISKMFIYHCQMYVQHHDTAGA